MANKPTPMQQRMLDIVNTHREALAAGDPTNSFILEGLNDDQLKQVYHFINSFDNAYVILPQGEDDG